MLRPHKYKYIIFVFIQQPSHLKLVLWVSFPNYQILMALFKMKLDSLLNGILTINCQINYITYQFEIILVDQLIINFMFAYYFLDLFLLTDIMIIYNLMIHGMIDCRTTLVTSSGINIFYDLFVYIINLFLLLVKSSLAFQFKCTSSSFINSYIIYLQLSK